MGENKEFEDLLRRVNLMFKGVRALLKEPEEKVSNHSAYLKCLDIMTKNMELVEEFKEAEVDDEVLPENPEDLVIDTEGDN